MKKFLIAAFLVGCGNAAGSTSPEAKPGATITAAPACSTQDVSMGRAGSTGAKGDTGPAGPAGPQGERGADGAMGAQGVAGPKGDTGDRGPQGLAGFDGARGLQGVQGNPGVAGPAGKDAVTITKDTVYTVLGGTGPLSGAQTVVLRAYCADANDVLLSGYCGTDDAVQLAMLAGGYGEPANLTQYYQCTAKHNGTGTHILTVVARCLAVP